jgi:hypothetical protein
MRFASCGNAARLGAFIDDLLNPWPATAGCNPIRLGASSQKATYKQWALADPWASAIFGVQLSIEEGRSLHRGNHQNKGRLLFTCEVKDALALSAYGSQMPAVKKFAMGISVLPQFVDSALGV